MRVRITDENALLLLVLALCAGGLITVIAVLLARLSEGRL